MRAYACRGAYEYTAVMAVAGLHENQLCALTIKHVQVHVGCFGQPGACVSVAACMSAAPKRQDIGAKHAVQDIHPMRMHVRKLLSWL